MRQNVIFATRGMVTRGFWISPAARAGVGGNPKHDAYGFRNWTEGVMFEYYTEGTTGRFLDDIESHNAPECHLRNSGDGHSWVLDLSGG
jgi:hypothetical protein